MPLPLLIPAVAASSQFGLTALIASSTAALTGGFAFGYQLNASKSNKQAHDERPLSSFIAELKDFPRQTKAIFAHAFRDFREDSAHLVESTKQLGRLSAQITDATHITQKNTKRLQEQVHEPLVGVGGALRSTQDKTDEVTGQLQKAQEALAQANQHIGILTTTLKQQQDTVTQLNAQIVPLTHALTVQTQEKERALNTIDQLKATVHQQIAGTKSELAAQDELNTRLSERLDALERELGGIDAQYQKSVTQKQVIEALLSDYKEQQVTLLQRIKELEKERQCIISGQELSSGESRDAYEQQLNALTVERIQLHQSLKQQVLINKKLEETVQLLEQQAASLESSLTQLKGDYETSKNKYQEACVLIASLNKEAQEQEALICAQEALIATLTAGFSSHANAPQGFFYKTAPTPEAVSQELSLTPK